MAETHFIPAQVRAGIIDPLADDRASGTWHSVQFQPPFTTEPVVVIAQTDTYNGSDTPNLRIQNVTVDGFDIRIDEVPGVHDGAHVDEVVAWVAYAPS